MSSAADNTDSNSNIVQLLTKRVYPIWSPFDAYEAAEALLQMLEKEKEKKSSALLDIEEIRDKHALRREAFAPLHEIFEDTPPAEEMVKKLRK